LSDRSSIVHPDVLLFFFFYADCMAENQEINTTVPEKQFLKYEDYLNSMTEKATIYHGKKIKLDLISTIVSYIVLISLVLLKVPNLLNYIGPFGQEYSFLSILWVAILFLTIYTLIGLPFSYMGEKTEREYEFSTLTWKKWAKNQLKGYLLMVVIASLMIEAIYSALHFEEGMWWLWGFGGYFIFAAVLTTLVPIVIIPLFTKLDPMPESSLRSKMEKLADDMGISYKDIYIWHLSDQSTKANAAVMGFGNTLRIVLGDTLINQFKEEEIEIVMCHEIGHQKHKDIYTGILFSGIVFLFAFYIIELLFQGAIEMLNFTARSDPASIGFFVTTLFVIQELTSIASNWYSRSREKKADLAALKHIPNMEVYESAFTRLAMQNLSYPNPGKFEILMRYSHPPIATRIKYARDYLESES